MASSKNSARRKRKYGDAQKARTARNKRNGKAAEERRMARLVERTQRLLGQHVKVRAKGYDRPLVGTVTDILRKGDDRYPDDAKRHSGSYLVVRTNVGPVTASRHRISIPKEK